MTNLHQGSSSIEVPRLPGRIPSLDGLRAISIALVLVGHGSMSAGSPAFLAPFHHFGNFGVRFFFVISGFLITTLLLKEWSKSGQISLKNFYIRLSLRLFPAAFAYIAVIAALTIAGIIRLKPGDMLHALTYTMNYQQVRSMWLDHLWSLSVEEQFYLLWPGLLILLGTRKAFKGAFLVVLIAPILRVIMWYQLGATETAMTKHFEAVADALATGCLLAGYFNYLGSNQKYLRLQSRAWLFLGFAMGLVGIGNGLYLIRPEWFYIFGQTLANIGTVLCIDWSIRNHQGVIGRFLNWKPIAFVGTLSYSLYLWQNPFFLGDYEGWFMTLPFNIGCVVIAAVISYYASESPFLKLKSRYEARERTRRLAVKVATATGSILAE
jgi:peptidoglycan/LPS O-acetylase OafA/YrhL